MNINEFIQKALITESTVDTVEVNEQLLVHTITMIISAGEILDQIKKNAFYGRQLDCDKIQQQLANSQYAATTLAGINPANFEQDTTTLEDINPRVFHSIVGVATEAVELLEALDLNKGTLDTVNVLEEYGDIDWYKAIGIDELNGDWEQILSTIITKLQARYNGQFSAEKANNRDLDNERQVLDNLANEDESDLEHYTGC